MAMSILSSLLVWKYMNFAIIIECIFTVTIVHCDRLACPLGTIAYLSLHSQNPQGYKVFLQTDDNSTLFSYRYIGKKKKKALPG